MTNEEKLALDAYLAEAELRNALIKRIEFLTTEVEELMESQKCLCEVLKETLHSHIDLLEVINCDKKLVKKWNKILKSLE